MTASLAAVGFPPLSAGLVAAEITVLGLGGVAAWLAVIAWRTSPSPVRTGHGRAALGIGLVVMGCRLGIGNGEVSWAPYLDQWYAILGDLLTPLAHGALRVGDLFAGNNEHRIVLTRSLDLGAVVLNREWDNRVLVVAMFLLQAVTVAVAALCAWRWLGVPRGTLVAAAAVVPMALRCDWENLVSGFQTQFGFLVLGTVLACGLLALRPLPAAAALSTVLLCVLLLGSMGSGLLTAVTTVVVLACAWSRGDVPARLATAALAGAAGVAVLGWCLRPAFSLPALQAHSAGEFLAAFLAYGCWPFGPHPLCFLWLWAPWSVLAGRYVLHQSAPPGSVFPCALGLWGLLQIAALAFSRAGLSGLVSARYTEVLHWMVFANGFALALLVPVGSRWRGGWFGLIAVWLVAAGGAELWRSQQIYQPYFAAFREQTREQERRLTTFARTGRAAEVADAVFPQVPAPPDVILPILEDPLVRPLLPAPLRQAYPGPVAEGGWLSFIAVRLLRTGLWWGVAGVLVLLSAWISARARNSGRKT